MSDGDVRRVVGHRLLEVARQLDELAVDGDSARDGKAAPAGGA